MNDELPARFDRDTSPALLTSGSRPGVARSAPAEPDLAGKGVTLSGSRSVVERVAVGDSVGAGLGFAWVPPSAALWARRTAEFSVTAPADAARGLSRELKMTADVDGNFVRLELQGPN